MPAPDPSAVKAELDRLTALFEAAGATLIETEVLQPAEVLLDLYGEDIRARAFVTRDDGGELMLRPDFTVPVVRHHLAHGNDPARYAYAGPVWRRQEAGEARAREYLQVGFELFDRGDPAEADAEVFALIHDALAGRGLSVAVGDLGLVRAAIAALDTTEQRKRALLRHLWRPVRFHRLLERFSGQGDGKADLIGRARSGNIRAMIAEVGAVIGTRGADEVAARIDRLVIEADTPALRPDEVARIERILDLGGSLASVAQDLRDVADGNGALGEAVSLFERRTAALERRGIDPETVAFEGSFGRTTLEYYDGFVFGVFAADRPDLPTIASGGRYDALTRVLGGGTGIPAVGAIVRPQALAEARP